MIIKRHQLLLIIALAITAGVFGCSTTHNGTTRIAKNTFKARWSSGGRYLYYFSDSIGKLRRYDTTNGNTTEYSKPPGWYDVSPNGRNLAVVNKNSSGEYYIVVYDLEKGISKHLHSTRNRINEIGWIGNDRIVFLQVEKIKGNTKGLPDPYQGIIYEINPQRKSLVLMERNAHGLWCASDGSGFVSATSKPTDDWVMQYKFHFIKEKRDQLLDVPSLSGKHDLANFLFVARHRLVYRIETGNSEQTEMLYLKSMNTKKIKLPHCESISPDFKKYWVTKCASIHEGIDDLYMGTLPESISK